MKPILLFPDTTNSELSKKALNHQSNTYYIAITAESMTAVDLQYISPQSMQWDHQTWLIDLGPCYNYWQYQSQKQHLRMEDLFRQLLQHACQEQLFYAAMATNPWQAILLTKSMENKGMKGFISISSMIGQNLFRHVSWNVWWDCCEQFYTVASRGQTYTAKQIHEFKQKITAMQRSMKRLGVQRPHQVNELPVQQIRRRFGSLLAKLWQMSFSSGNTSFNEDATHKYDFPWQSFQQKIKACRKTTLDHPIIEWSQVEAYLAGDLNQLCLLDSFKKDDRIINLEWRVVLQDLTDVPINIFFRHPHDLHREAPHYRTALLQVFYQFQKFRRDLDLRYHDLLTSPPAIIGWQLTIDQSMRTLPQQKHLFESQNNEIDRLMTIENQLPIELEHYQIERHWVAEHSFGHYGKPLPHDLQDLDSSLQILSIQRPLYIYEKPKPFTDDGLSAMRYFCERSMDQWWSCPSDNKQRDYYRYMSESRHLWLFQDESGRWFIHGVYS